MSARLFVLAALAVACAEPPPRAGARPVDLGPPPVASADLAPSASPPPRAAPVASAPAPDQDAAPPGLDPALLEAEAATPVPDAPAKTAITGSAAIVWEPESSAPYGFKSVLIEDAGGSARVVGERAEPVFVGAKALFVLREKNLASRACDECELCVEDPPKCKKDVRYDIQQPFLKPLGAGKTLEPWRNAFSPRNGCAGSVGSHDTQLQVLGGVGSVYFVSVHVWDQFCGGAHAVYADEPLSFDIDTGREVKLTFPGAVLEPLKKRAHAELAPGCVIDPTETPSPYRALAQYGASGAQEGVFLYLMAAPYMCGTGPGHYSAVSEQVSDWIPPELARYGKLPAWVADHLKAVGAKHAFMLGKATLGTARRELKRRVVQTRKP